MSKFGDLIRGIEAPAPAPAPEPVVEAPTPEPVEVESSPSEFDDETDPVMDALEELTKDELEIYGREIGIELDKRHSKSKLIKELHEAEKNLE